MNILIVGLGLIGGAYALNLSKNHYIYGVDINQESIDYALKNKYINEGSKDAKDFIKKSDLIILALSPKTILDFLNTYKNEFLNTHVITDVCGIKASYILDAVSMAKPATYIAHHPMTGCEKNGIFYSHTFSFVDKNYIITTTKDTEDKNAIDILTKIGNDLNMKVSICDYKKHDQMIAYTSDLTHAIAVSLMNSNRDETLINFAGRSFLEMTRIANINENLWSEIFIENSDNLLEQINIFMDEMEKMKHALESKDDKVLKELFISSKKIRKEI